MKVNEQTRKRKPGVRRQESGVRSRKAAPGRCAYALVLLLALTLVPAGADGGKKKDARKSERNRAELAAAPAVIWRAPGDIASRDLFWGPGGKDHAPKGAFTFVKEDMNGTNPKFDVTGQDGVKWKVKLGVEARAESAADRIVWAAGYFADEDYFVPYLSVRGMPSRLHRGWKMVGADGSVRNVRLKREDKSVKKLGHWSWRHDEFTGSREWNGLRVMMALINNWDLKDDNTAIDESHGQRIFLVSDLGAAFGTAGRTWPTWKAKDDFDSYSHSLFIRRVHGEFVNFATPGRPNWKIAVNPRSYFSRIRMEWIGRDIPVADARWIGGVLAGLSHQQICDAFRASGYSPREVEAFAGIVQQRIAALTRL